MHKSIPILADYELIGRKATAPVTYSELITPSSLKKPKKLNHLYIALFECGTGTIQVDQKQYDVTGNLAIVGFPGQVLKWNFPQGLKAIQLLVAEDVYEVISCISKIRVGILEPISALTLDADTFGMLRRELLEIRKLQNSPLPDMELIVARFRLAYLILKSCCMDRRILHTNSIENPVLKAFIAMIEKGPLSRRSLTYYAKELHVSVRYLNAICKKNMNTSAAQLVRSYVTHEAKRMLVESELRVKEVAFSLGFSNLPTFTKYFKKETGFSPKTFKSLRKDIGNPAL